MKIIGIHNTGVMSSATLCIDGKIVHAISEERLARQKYSKYFPHNAINNCLKKYNLKLSEIDIFAIGWNPAVNIAYKYRAGLSEWQQTAGERFYSNPNNILPHIIGDKSILSTEQIFNLDKLQNKKILYVTHHLSHIYNAYFLSNFQNAGVFSCDGYGERTTTCWAKAKKNDVKIIREINFPHSIGQFYSTITQYLGFRPDLDEWKVMGASSYGNPAKYFNKIKKLLRYNSNSDLELNLEYFEHYNFESKNMFTSKLSELLGKPRKQNDKILKKHFDIAAATQKVLEEYIFVALKWFKKNHNIKNICLTGGVFMNSVLNGKIVSSKLFDKVFIPYAPDDSGNSIGSALFAYYSDRKKLRKIYYEENPYLGNSYDDKEILFILKKYKQKFKKIDNICDYTTNLLIEGKIIGWFQGRSEFGQRALGNRSILADPRLKHMKDKINSSIKYREKFRPFAPAILEDKVKNFFKGRTDSSNYMEKVFYFKEDKVNKVPAVAHVDNSGRLQTVSKKINPLFYNLIEFFYQKTNVPIILNTSFNLNNEPIVESPQDAIRTFHTCGLDVLVIGNYVIKK